MRWLRGMFFVGGSAMFGYVLMQLGPGEVLRVITGLGWTFAAVLALWSLHQMLRAAVLQACMGETGVRFGSILRVRLAGESLQFLTPTGPFLAEPAKAWLLRQRGLPAAETYSAILAEYLFYTLSSSVMAVGGMTTLLALYPLGTGLRAAAWMVLGSAVAFLAAAAWAIARRFHLIGAILRWLERQGWLGKRRIPDQGLRATEDRLLDVLRAPAPRLVLIVSLECAAQLCLVVELGLCIAATGLAAGWQRVLLLESAVKYVGLAFFFIPAQVGASEGTYSVLAAVLGWPAALGFGLALVRRLRSLITALAGFALLTMERRAFTRAGTALLAALLICPAEAQVREVKDVQKFVGASAKEWASVERGEAFVKVLPPSDPQEAALMGAVRVNAGLACFLTQFRDIENFKRGSGVLRVQKLSQPARAEDFARLELGSDDLAALRDCRKGNCGVKLPPGFLDAWKKQAGVTAGRTQQMFRESLRAYIEAYLAAGDAALVTYEDGEKPLVLASEFREALQAQPGLQQAAPEFHAALLRYTGANAGAPSGFVYWSVENFGLKPVLSVTHVLEYQQPGMAAIVSKQIYANHYFDASLGLTVAVQPQGGHLYLVYVNRSRVDLLGGLLGGVRRRLGRGRALDGMRNNLTEVASRLAANCR
jgi:hypothetical protein